MKKISTLFASFILAVSVFAAERPKSTLVIQSASQAGLKVVIDGRRFEPYDNFIRIQGIDAGYHQVKIYQEKNTGLFGILGRRYEVVFNSSVTVRPRGNTMISIDRFGRAVVTDNRGNGWGDRDRQNDNIDFGRGNRDGDYSNDRDNDHGHGNDHGGQWGGYDNHNGGYDNHSGGYDNHNGYDGGMNDREFDAVLQSINKEWLESNKLKSATQIVRNNSLTAAQVKEIILLFSFESNKLDLAKQAYFNTVDKSNYKMIYDVFSFNSSKEELARFLRTSK